MPEARTLNWPAQPHPAIGGGGRLPRKSLLRRGAAALALILLLGLAKEVVAARETGLVSLNAIPGGRSVTGSLKIGSAPTDMDLQALAATYQVDGVVNLGAPNVAEEATADSLHQSYLPLPVAGGAAPTWGQLQTLLKFMHKHIAAGKTVYVHDDEGGGRVVATSDMLLLLRGDAWSTVSRGMMAEERRWLSNGQLQAINELISALHANHHPLPGNPYAAARLTPW